MADALRNNSPGLSLGSSISFLSAIVRAATSDKAIAVELSESDLPVVKFAVADYLYWSVRMSEPSFTVVQM
jgi:hypothetical protein